MATHVFRLKQSIVVVTLSAGGQFPSHCSKPKPTPPPSDPLLLVTRNTSFPMLLPCPPALFQLLFYYCGHSPYLQPLLNTSPSIITPYFDSARVPLRKPHNSYTQAFTSDGGLKTQIIAFCRLLYESISIISSSLYLPLDVKVRPYATVVVGDPPPLSIEYQVNFASIVPDEMLAEVLVVVTASSYRRYVRFAYDFSQV